MVNISSLMSENIQHHILMTWSIKKVNSVCIPLNGIFCATFLKRHHSPFIKCYNDFFWLVVNTSIYSCPESSQWVLISIKHWGHEILFQFCICMLIPLMLISSDNFFFQQCKSRRVKSCLLFLWFFYGPKKFGKMKIISCKHSKDFIKH